MPEVRATGVADRPKALVLGVPVLDPALLTPWPVAITTAGGVVPAPRWSCNVNAGKYYPGKSSESSRSSWSTSRYHTSMQSQQR